MYTLFLCLVFVIFGCEAAHLGYHYAKDDLTREMMFRGGTFMGWCFLAILEALMKRASAKPA